jgi:hypothetical protein
VNEPTSRRWTIGGGYDGARHSMFVFAGPQLPPFEKAEVMPVSEVRDLLDRLSGYTQIIDTHKGRTAIEGIINDTLAAFEAALDGNRLDS